MFGYIKKIPNVKIIYLHAKRMYRTSIIGNIDIGFPDWIYLKMRVILQKQIKIIKKLNFGKANLVFPVIPDLWIDVQTLLDLEEVSDEFKRKKKINLFFKIPKFSKAIFIFIKNNFN